MWVTIIVLFLLFSLIGVIISKDKTYSVKQDRFWVSFLIYIVNIVYYYYFVARVGAYMNNIINLRD